MSQMAKTTKQEEIQEQPKECMVYLKSIKTQSFEISAGKRAKLSQFDIEAMHEEIKVIYPRIGDWVSKVQPKDCKCKK